MSRMVFALLCTGVLLSLGAQETKKKRAPMSPPAETSVTMAGKSIAIKYSAPSMRGRKIFGGLEQYGGVWRAGANSATALHTDAALEIGGLKVPPGDYTLYVLLDEKQWQLIVNKQTGQWGTEYSQAQDLGRVKMTMSKPAAPVETFKITLTAGKLEMEWENTVASVAFTAK